MPDHSRARLFFEETLARRENAFQALCNLIGAEEPEAENSWRDYKEAGFIGQTDNRDKENESVKRTWSENLSAFVNTGGGVLIWGLHTKGNIPDKLSLAQNCVDLADRLRTLLKDATDPSILGVEIEAIRASPESTAGIVLCHIPSSSFAPHQALWGERLYFIRVQDSNLPCPQPLLRNMFYPRTGPKLIPQARVSVSEGDDKKLHIGVYVVLQNKGSASAEKIHVEALGRSDRGLECHPARLWTARQFTDGYDCATSIHPAQAMPFLQNMSHRGGYESVDELPEKVTCEFRIFAHDASALFASVEFFEQELKDAALNQKRIVRDATVRILEF